VVGFGAAYGAGRACGLGFWRYSADFSQPLGVSVRFGLVLGDTSFLLACVDGH
jgi:hypothetical protein